MARKTLKEQAASDLAALFSTDLPWVETVSYTPAATGVTVSCPAIVSYGQAPEQVRSGGSSGLSDRAEISIRRSDVATIAYRDSIVLDGNTWQVSRVIGATAVTWLVEIRRNERPVW